MDRTAPNVELLLERAARDCETGDVGRARERLLAYIGQFDFDARFALALGELELASHSRREAARWLWLAGSNADAHRELIREFLERYRGEGLWQHVPASIRRGRQACPEPIARVLKDAGIDVEQRQAKALAKRKRDPDRLGLLGWFAVTALVGVVVLGLRQLVLWVDLLFE